MTSPIKRGFQEKIHHLQSNTHADYPSSHNQDVGIIVLPAQSGCEKVMANTRPDPFITVSHDSHTKARPADQDTTLVFIFGYSLCYLVGNFGII